MQASSASALDVQDFIDQHPFSGYQWVVLILCFLIVLVDGFDTAAIGYIAPSLISEWGITRPALAPVLSAALFGLAFGALAAGPIADRIGRKWLLLISLAIMGCASLVSASAANLDQLTMWRFVTGLGLGAAMPSAVTLMSEYSPTPRRAFMTSAMFCGFPLGSACGGFFAAWMIPQFGWRSLLVLGGLLPLLLLVLSFIWMPESARFLVARARQSAHDKVVRILQRIHHSANAVEQFVSSEVNSETAGSVQLVLSRQFILGTLMLWLAYFMGLVVIYAMFNWLPILLRDAGIAPNHAAYMTAMFQLGGVGTLLFGFLMDRFNPNWVIASGYVLTCISLALMGQVVGGSFLLLVAVVFVAGLVLNASQAAMPPLAAGFYPTRARATGVAWMLGIGRFGGIAGSFLVAELSRYQLGLPQVLLIVGLPGLVAAAALLIKSRFSANA